MLKKIKIRKTKSKILRRFIRSSQEDQRIQRRDIISQQLGNLNVGPSINFTQINSHVSCR